MRQLFQILFEKQAQGVPDISSEPTLPGYDKAYGLPNPLNVGDGSLYPKALRPSAGSSGEIKNTADNRIRLSLLSDTLANAYDDRTTGLRPGDSRTFAEAAADPDNVVRNYRASLEGPLSRYMAARQMLFGQRGAAGLGTVGAAAGYALARRRNKSALKKALYAALGGVAGASVGYGAGRLVGGLRGLSGYSDYRKAFGLPSEPVTQDTST